MATEGRPKAEADASKKTATPDVDAALTGGNYEVLRARLTAAGAELAGRADALNARRKTLFGATEPQLVATERVRSEHNCVPVDIVSVRGQLLLGFNVFLGLKAETSISDVLALHRFEKAGSTGGDADSSADSSYDTSTLPLDSFGGFLTNPDVARDFANLYRYYRDAQLLQLVKRDTQLLAVFQAGASWKERKVLRWQIEPSGDLRYLDDRGDRDYAALFPPAYDFEWREVTRDQQVAGKHPHYNILDSLFVECVHGDLTIKIEDNTSTGQGIYSEQVEDANQSLDDARVFYAPIGKPGGLILLKILPFREQVWRYLAFDARSHKIIRADGIGQGCRSLPEDHGVVFPGGYLLVGGEHKLFDGDNSDFALERELPSPNGEDVLYVYQRGRDSSYLLYAYNLIDKAVRTPIPCNGYSLFPDGRMVVMRGTVTEPTRVHPMQVWQTPFTSAEHAALAPVDQSYLSKVGNAELVRGLSDALSVARLAAADKPNRSTFEDILALSTRASDGYYWLGHAEVGDLKSAVAEVRGAAKLILDEYDKVVALEAEARRVLAETEAQVAEKLQGSRSEGFTRIDPFLDALTGLRNLRGTLITRKEVRFIDVARLSALEAEVVTAFERVTSDCAAFLAKGDAFGELVGRAQQLAQQSAGLGTAVELKTIREDIDKVAGGIDLLGNVIGALKIDDTTKRTAILENITDAFGQVNRARATIEGRYRELAAKEGKAAFGAQVKLLAQSVASSLAQCDTPERCDQELTRLLIQLEELEGRFAEVEELTAELATRREEVVDAVGARKQQLTAQRQRRTASLVAAAQRILEGVKRRGQLPTAEEVNSYFAADPMVQKLRDLAAELAALGDAVKADEVTAQLKVAYQDALRGQRDKSELFDGGGNLLRFGEHRFAVNEQPFDVMIVPRGEGLAIHLAGTDFYEPLADERLLSMKGFWGRDLPSESEHVYRAEYLAASVLAEAEGGAGAGANALTVARLRDAVRDGGLEALLRQVAQERYDEGYERGVHDHDAAKILEALLSLRGGAGLLAYPSAARTLAVLFWGAGSPAAPAPGAAALPVSVPGLTLAALTGAEAVLRARWHRSAQSLARLAGVFGDRGGRRQLTDEIARELAAFVERERLADPVLGLGAGSAAELTAAAAYLVHELGSTDPHFAVSGEASQLAEHLRAELEGCGMRMSFDDDVRALAAAPGAAYALTRAWVEGIAARRPELAGAAAEAAAFLATPQLARQVSTAAVEAKVTGLLGRHARIQDGVMVLRIDELLSRLDRFRTVEAPAFRDYRAARAEIAERERRRLRVDELRPKVMSSFVRNRLIDEVYLPLVGANFAKQLGAAGASKRTDQMGLLLLVSPPGYGKTTLMEYVATRLGLAFVKVNGPTLGHVVTSLDPADAPNATARQEVEKVSLALEMGTNVMLYLDDIQHTSPELLQKFVSLCDAQRKIEGVWRGHTRTYDLRGKKFCIVMAGNPYTESGETFRIPDMLANRADVYNLGEVLTGKQDAFALSFLENSLTSNPITAPLATRDLSDVYKLVRMARGEAIPTTELSHGYSAVELSELLAVLRHLFTVQATLLKVNAEYIRSAAQADAFRTEPPFKLQGSYRNMNKVSEKIVAAMTPAEVEAVLDDHYRGEAQTLTTAAEQNLLKLAELRGRLSPEQAKRWADIKAEYVRQRRMGGGDDDPVTRLVGTLGGLGAELGAIREALGTDQTGELRGEVERLRETLTNISERWSIEESLRAEKLLADAAERDIEGWLRPRLDALTQAMRARPAAAAGSGVDGHGAAPGGAVPAPPQPGLSATDKRQLHDQFLRIERMLSPVAGAAADQRAGDTLMANKMVQIIELLEQLSARLGIRA
jgi:ATPase involved in DNA repair/ATPase family associated with various cellular activities (AAA)